MPPLADVPQAHPSIDEVLKAFLAEQQSRLSPRTFKDYEETIRLLRNSLNNYASGDVLSLAEQRRYEEACREYKDGSAFCQLFGPEKIVAHLNYFLKLYVPDKVLVGPDPKALGAAAGALTRWLGEQGYIDTEAAKSARTKARSVSRGRSKAERFRNLLDDVADSSPEIDRRSLSHQDWFEGFAYIDDVDPGEITFTTLDFDDGDIGPVSVPVEVSSLAEEGWQVFIEAARIDGTWQLLGVGTIYP